MTRFILATPLLLTLVAFASGKPRAEPYAPKDGRFSVRLPGIPKETTQTVKSDIGSLKVFTATYATSDSNVFLVSYTDFPASATKKENLDTLFDGIRDVLKDKDGKVQSEKKTEVGPDKFPGRDFEIEKGKQRMKYKVIVRENRLYQVAVIGSSAFVAGKEAAAFFESFEFTK